MYILVRHDKATLFMLPKVTEGKKKKKKTHELKRLGRQHESHQGAELHGTCNSAPWNMGTSIDKATDTLPKIGPFWPEVSHAIPLAKKIPEANLEKLISMEYSLDNFHRSNQDTCLVHKPAVFEGQWVQSGDLLADCSASVGGELALGQNILIAYMPWEGYNFEDAILVSERLVYDDLYTSVHIERYEVELRETKLGFEEITREIPDVPEASLKHLNVSGIAKLGSWVEEGDILVGKVTPINKKSQSNYQKLLYTILDKAVLPIRDSSLRAPKGIKAKVIGIQIFKNSKNILTLGKPSSSAASFDLLLPYFTEGEKSKVKEGKLKVKRSIEGKASTQPSTTQPSTTQPSTAQLVLPSAIEGCVVEAVLPHLNLNEKTKVNRQAPQTKVRLPLSPSLFSSKPSFFVAAWNIIKLQKQQRCFYGNHAVSQVRPSDGKAFCFVPPKVSEAMNMGTIETIDKKTKVGQRSSVAKNKKRSVGQKAKVFGVKNLTVGLKHTSIKESPSPDRAQVLTGPGAFFSLAWLGAKGFWEGQSPADKKKIELYNQNNILIDHNKFKIFSSFYALHSTPTPSLFVYGSHTHSFANLLLPPSYAGKAIEDKRTKVVVQQENKFTNNTCLNKMTSTSRGHLIKTREERMSKIFDNLNFATAPTWSGPFLLMESLYKDKTLKKKYGTYSEVPTIKNDLKEKPLKPLPVIKLQRATDSFITLNQLRCRRLGVESKKSMVRSPVKKILKGVSSVQVYLAEKRRIQVGDKMAGRHGNKGIISQILPTEDMPFLPDGRALDMVLNPLGVPSRMNVGQIYECLLGLAGKHLGENFKVFPFDEIYGAEASRSFVYSKLYSARTKTGKQWLFNQNSPGKIRLYDGRTGETFDQAITVGYAYMLRLVHMVDDKIHCLTADHDVLTTQGWVPIDQVTLDHQVATLKPNGDLVYKHPTKIYNFPQYNGDMYHIKNTNLDLFVTPNHRMYVKNGKKNGASFDGYELLEASSIKGKHKRYLKNAHWPKPDYQFVLPSCFLAPLNSKAAFSASFAPLIYSEVQGKQPSLFVYGSHTHSFANLLLPPSYAGKAIEDKKTKVYMQRMNKDNFISISQVKVIPAKEVNMQAWLTLFGLFVAFASFTPSIVLTVGKKEGSVEGCGVEAKKNLGFNNSAPKVEEAKKKEGQLKEGSLLLIPPKIASDTILTTVVKDVYQVQICQCKPHVVAVLTEAVKKLGYSYSIVDYKVTIDNKQLWTYLQPLSPGVPLKHLPDWVWSLSQGQARALLHAMCLGDSTCFIFGKQDCSLHLPYFTEGQKTKGGKGEMRPISIRNTSESYYTSSIKLADDVMRLVLHAGWSANQYLHQKAGDYGGIINGRQIIAKHNLWRIAIIKSKNNPSVNHGHHKEQSVQTEALIPNFKGAVHCLSVPNEVFYVRRNGLTSWTGNSRSTGPYSLVTQQPLRGRSKQGGQRLGEMEVWALEGYGAAFTLLEMLTIKSDDMTGRMTLWSNLILNKEISIGTPESFKVLICELQALCLDIGLFKVNPTKISPTGGELA